MVHLVIRADGGPEIGYGHVVRTSALAEEALSRGHDVTYATTTPDSVREVCPGSIDVVELPTRSDPAPFADWIEAVSPDLAFTDAYPIDAAYQRSVRERVPLVVLRDDARATICADVFTNGNLHATESDYAFVGSEPRTCLGPDYALLRSEITELAGRRPPWRSTPERALVTMGGSDTANLTPTVLRAFDGCDLTVDAIVGPGFSEAQEAAVEDASADVSTDVRILRDPDDLAERMFRADFAICTASSTIYELLALGTPIACTPVVENQEPIAGELRRRDAAIVLKRDDEDFGRAIEAYSRNPDLRRERRERGRALVDGKGATRLYAEMLSVLDGHP